MKRATIFALLSVASFTALAQEAVPPDARRGPPQAAFDACKGKQEGARVEGPSPRGDTVKGSCRMLMIPERAPGGERGRAGGKGRG